MTPLMISDVESFWIAQMGTRSPSTVLLFPNDPVPETQGIFAQIHVVPGDSLPINLGITAKSRNVGIIQIDVYGPKDVGAGGVHNVASLCGLIFRRQTRTISTEGNLVCKDPSVVDTSNIRGRHSFMARIPYRYDFNQLS